ncbi:MAG: septal ring lytic transglycosylase RlpA family protein, partial [Methylotenera sp.]
MLSFERFIITVCISLITACGSAPAVKKTPDKPVSTDKKGGFYLDDGPGDNPPPNLDSIPDAELKSETPLVYPNKPYTALGKKYTPMTQYAPYTQRGVASWYGKRYHGKKTSSGEVYDMYAMSGAHTTLPIPSYVKVTNLSNKRTVIVRINDRGPFKHDRLIDLSYAAAHRLGLVAQGSGMVEVEWIDTSPEALSKLKSNAAGVSTAVAANNVASETKAAAETKPLAAAALMQEAPIQAVSVKPAANAAINTESETTAPESVRSYFVQLGAFKNEMNSDLLQKKVLGLDIA